MKDKTVYLSEIWDILESLEREADRENDAKGYIALMKVAEKIQKLTDAKEHK